MSLDHLITARAAALFASDLPHQSRPSQAAVQATVSGALTACGGIDGCLGVLAAAYGDHPETAAPRMRWARQVIDATCRPATATATDAGVRVTRP